MSISTIKTKLKIRVYGNPCLRKKALKVKEITSAEKILIASMVDAMHEKQGIGLAAPQVGISQQILAVDIGEGPLAMINPKIVKKYGWDVMEEGCLSFPGVSIHVRRPKIIVVRYLDQNGEKNEQEFGGLMAKVVQHEMDHLNGKLIIDYAGFKERLKYRKQLKELRQLSKQNN